jgi:hypothetical protein
MFAGQAGLNPRIDKFFRRIAERKTLNSSSNSQRYAEMAAADRDLRIDGYGVYRFGGMELMGERGLVRAGDFFERLFRLYKLPICKSMHAAQKPAR